MNKLEIDKFKRVSIALELVKGRLKGTEEDVNQAWQYLHDTGVAYRCGPKIKSMVEGLLKEGVIK